MFEHYGSLIITYGVATICWFLIYYKTRFGKYWTTTDAHTEPYSKPYWELLFAFLAVLAIIAIGQLYINNLLIPNASNNNLVDALNQLLIFSPTFILLFIRKQSVNTIWLKPTFLLQRLSIGVVISILAMILYHLVRKDASPLHEFLLSVYHPSNISHLTQVFLEDCTIALLFYRLTYWIGDKWSIVIVAILFALAHIPSLMANGASIQELQNLLFDTMIGTIVFTALTKSKDIAWFIPLHFVMDMAQYHGGN